VETAARDVDQFILARLTGGRDGRDDAATGSGDFGVRGAGETAPQLVAAIAGEDRVRVRVDEPGDDRQRAAVDGLRGRCISDVRGEIRVAAGKDDPAVVARHRTVGNDGDVALARTGPGRTAGAGNQLPDVSNEQQ